MYHNTESTTIISMDKPTTVIFSLLSGTVVMPPKKKVPHKGLKEQCCVCCQPIILGKDECLFCSGDCLAPILPCIKCYGLMKASDAPFSCLAAAN